jgi:glycosyltransferase involved in cell wall biosynthesis
MSDCLVVIPAFNEASSIGKVVDGVKRAAGDVDVVVIDDGSTDETARIALAHGAIMIPHPYNLGYGVALQTGYRFAVQEGYSTLVQIDADGQHDPDAIRQLALPILEGEADVVTGSRFFEGSEYKMPWLRQVGSAWFRTLVRLCTGLKLSDPTTGFQALSREVVELYASDVFPGDYPDADVLVFLHRNGFRIREIPVVMWERSESPSMHSGVKILYYVYKMTLAILMNVLRRPVVTGASREDLQ